MEGMYIKARVLVGMGERSCVISRTVYFSRILSVGDTIGNREI